MLLTKEFDYAARALSVLADGEKKTVKVICEEENLPELFVYRILKKLETEGIVKCERGVKGGASLVRDIHDICMADVMKAIYGGFNVIGMNEVNKMTEEYARIEKAIIEEMNQRSFGEILESK